MEQNLYLCKIDPAYLKYLHKIDNRISVKYNNRPFVGVITMLNGIPYVLPLTSQTTEERKKEGKNKRSAKITTFVRDSAGNEIANILHNNMFPVKEGVYSIMEINAESDTYESNEIRFIRKNKDSIINRAQKVHTERTTKNNSFMNKTCCDFKKLENDYLGFSVWRKTGSTRVFDSMRIFIIPSQHFNPRCWLRLFVNISLWEYYPLCYNYIDNTFCVNRRNYMDYRELDSNDYEVAIGEKFPNGIKQITITVKKDAPFCEECLSVEAVKKSVTSRKVLDVVDKQPVQYIINRYRYRCLECGRTFVNETLYEPKVRVAPEFGDFIAQKILQDDLTEKEAAKKYGVSTTYISQAMHDYKQEFEKDILSIAPCSVLVFYPFEYSSRTRCGVIGTDWYGRNILVGILADCSGSSIYEFVHEKIKNLDEVKTVYCDVTPYVFEYLSATFPNADIRIINDSLIKFCTLFNKDTGDVFLNEKNNHAKKFDAIVRFAGTSTSPLGQALRNWWQETPESIREHFALMWTYVEACIDGCRNEPIPDGLKASIDTTFEIIKRFRKENVQFDIMILKTLFKGEAVIR